jgi:AcrR family transcriptional regulator
VSSTKGDRARRPLSEFKLPPGRHGITPQEVEQNQRWRLLGAAAQVLAEQGYVATTSTRVCRVAGVSPATFYRYFDDVADCLLVAHQAALDCVFEIVAEACRDEAVGWRQRLAVAVAQLMRFRAVEQATAPLLGPAAVSGERAIAAARGEAVDRLARLLAGGRRLRPSSAPDLPSGTERHLVAGAVAAVGARVAEGDFERLPELAPELIEILAAPYVA